nr:MAG TPA: hypothetical protein [Caudoviricetes sp.]
MTNVLDLLTDEEKKEIKARYQERIKRRQNSSKPKITPEIYLMAKFGIYFGWEAVRDVLNDKISLEMMFAMIEGAEKVYYSQLCENTRGTFVAQSSSMAKNGFEAQKCFNTGTEAWRKKAKMEV